MNQVHRKSDDSFKGHVMTHSLKITLTPAGYKSLQRCPRKVKKVQRKALFAVTWLDILYIMQSGFEINYICEVKKPTVSGSQFSGS